MMRLGARALMSSYSARTSAKVGVSPLPPVGSGGRPPPVGVGGVFGDVVVGLGVGVGPGLVGGSVEGPVEGLGMLGDPSGLSGGTEGWAAAVNGQASASRRAIRQKARRQMYVRGWVVPNIKRSSPIANSAFLRVAETQTGQMCRTIITVAAGIGQPEVVWTGRLSEQ